MHKPRIIKKYSNRRLYDTSISKYITLDEVRDLVIKQIKFKVIDNSSDEDMTNYVLLQVITESESGPKPIFTAEILQNIIRFYDHPLQKALRSALEKCFQNPTVDIISEFTKQNLEFWQNAIFSPKKPIKSKTKKNKASRRGS